MQTLPIVADGPLRAATDEIIANPPDVVLANTGIGMRSWLSAADSWGVGEQLADTLRDVEIVARGPKAAGSLVTIGCDVRWRGLSGRLAEVINHLLERDLTGVRICCQRDGSELDQAAVALRAAGAEVVEVATYKWLRPDDETAAIRMLDAICDETVDAVTFTSRPAIENLLALAHERGQADALLGACEGHVLPVTIGPVCYDAAIDNGFKTAIAPTRMLIGAMVNALVDALQHRRVTAQIAVGELALTGVVVHIGEDRIELTAREAAVLAVLVGRAGTVVPKSVLLKEVWGDGADPHSLEMVISRLRRQLGPASSAIRTVLRRGYMLATD